MLTTASLIILAKYVLMLLLGFILFFIWVIISLILFGSSVDPDDNGILRSKKQREKYRQYKLNKIYNSGNNQ